MLVGLGLETIVYPLGVGEHVEADATGLTAVPGVWVAGNVADLTVQVVGAAEAGVRAGAAINAKPRRRGHPPRGGCPPCPAQGPGRRRALAPSAGTGNEARERVLGERRHGPRARSRGAALVSPRHKPAKKQSNAQETQR